MKNKMKLSAFIALTGTILLASCGGGGNIGDGTIKLTTSPSKIEISSTDCGYVSGPTVTVYGGVAPYRLNNPLPRGIGLSTDKINNAGGKFKIDTIGGCFDTLPVLILDSDGNTFEFEITHKFIAPTE
jgi:hypothetical protein